MKKLFFLSLLASLFFTSCLKDTGTLEVTYFEANAVYGDLEEIRSQPINLTDGNEIYNDFDEIINPGKVYVGSDFILIGEEEKGIHVYNNTDINNPVHINFINIPGNREFFVHDNFLYAESYYDVVKYNISQLGSIKELGRSLHVFNDDIKNDMGQSLLGFTFNQVTKTLDKNSDLYRDILEDNVVYFDFAQNIIPQSAVPTSFAGSSTGESGTVNRINLYNGYLYVVNRNSILVINESNMDLVNRVEGASSEMETVIPYKNKLFIGTRTSMDIYDVSNSSQPQHDYAFNHVESCDPVLPHKEAAFITLRTGDFADCPGNTNALIVLDISNIENPKQVMDIPLHSPYGMSIINDKLYVGEGQNGLTIFDITNPYKPQNKSTFDIEAYDVILHPTYDNLILVAGNNGLTQYTLDSDQSFTIESTIDY